jgi:hypothetical protein
MIAHKNQLDANFFLASAIAIASILTFINPAKAQTADPYINQFLQETNELIEDDRAEIDRLSSPFVCQPENYLRSLDDNGISTVCQEYNIDSSHQMLPMENIDRQSVRSNNRQES